MICSPDTQGKSIFLFPSEYSLSWNVLFRVNYNIPLITGKSHPDENSILEKATKNIENRAGDTAQQLLYGLDSTFLLTSMA